MVKYLNAELYKARHRVYQWAFLAVMLGLIAAALLTIKFNTGPRATAEIMVSGMMFLLSIGLYLVIIVCDIVFSEQYKHNTLKNEVSFGLPRWRIYLGKLLTSILVAVAMCVAFIAFFVGLSCLLFPIGEGMGETLANLGQALAMAFPLWLGGLGFYLMLSFLLKGSTASAILYAVIMSMGGGFLELFSEFLPKLEPVFTTIQNCLLMTPFNQLPYRPMAELIPYGWGLGLAWFVISTVVGLIAFQKREIS